jgi:hypothetical protein
MRHGSTISGKAEDTARAMVGAAVHKVNVQHFTPVSEAGMKKHRLANDSLGFSVTMIA